MNYLFAEFRKIGIMNWLVIVPISILLAILIDELFWGQAEDRVLRIIVIEVVVALVIAYLAIPPEKITLEERWRVSEVNETRKSFEIDPPHLYNKYGGRIEVDKKIGPDGSSAIVRRYHKDGKLAEVSYDFVGESGIAAARRLDPTSVESSFDKDKT